jgi:hypothetical protein
MCPLLDVIYSKVTPSRSEAEVLRGKCWGDDPEPPVLLPTSIYHSSSVIISHPSPPVHIMSTFISSLSALHYKSIRTDHPALPLPQQPPLPPRP